MIQASTLAFKRLLLVAGLSLLGFSTVYASISGSSQRSISGSSLRSISGSSLRSISGSSMRSISGSSLRSISGSSQRSISGSSQRSISGSSQRSISGSSQRSISGSSQRSISGSSQRSNDLSEDPATLMAYGPLTGVGPGVVEILGQAIALAAGDPQPSADAVGKSAYIEGVYADGAVVASTLQVFEDYSVPGASPVFIAGIVASVQANLGTLAIGDVAIDVNSLDSADVNVGDTIVVTGTQPLPGGVLLAQSLLIVTDPVESANAVEQSLRSISGSSNR